MLEVGNLQASIKGYFSYFLIMKEVTDFLRKTKWIEVYCIDGRKLCFFIREFLVFIVLCLMRLMRIN